MMISKNFKAFMEMMYIKLKNKLDKLINKIKMFGLVEA